MKQNDSENSTQSSNDERREFFRVEDRVQLKFISCSFEQVEHTPAETLFEHSTVKSLTQELRRIDHDNQHLLRSLTENHRSLELYLKSINRKIDLVASQLCAAVNENENKKRKLVTLSESGLAFLHPELVAEGDYLALELTLLPSYSSLFLYAQVISCVQGPGKYRVGIQFLELADIDRQALAKQVMHCQLVQKRMSQNDDVL